MWDGKKMYYWDSVVHPFISLIKDTPYPKLFYLPMSFLVGDSNDFVWQQFTRLLDKNGKEIYEGDIVRVLKYLSPYGEPCPIFEIIFKDGMFTYKNTKFDSEGIMVEENENINEVIGNIYENSELLELLNKNNK
jgi:uncharacterized phage protein (TIGR01671 family)